jgi:signal transduction histidine kinase
MGAALWSAVQRGRAARWGDRLAAAAQAQASGARRRAADEVLAAAGAIAGGAAHEMNNPLAAIRGRAQWMARRAPAEADRRAWGQIAEQAQRASDTITALMAAVSPPRPRPAAQAAAALLAAAARQFAASDHPKAAATRVDIHAGPHLPPVFADAAQLREALAELLSNAARAGGERPLVRLTASAAADGAAVRLAVADDGRGMDDGALAAACVPFFSSQPAGRRPGLGLTRVRRIVENHGGRMWIRSRPQEGTTVCLLLPAATGRRAEASDAGTAAQQRRSGADRG